MTLKSIKNAAVMRILSSLPRGVRRKIVNDAIARKSISYKQLCEIAKNFNVVAFSVKGDYGVIQNTTEDRVMTPYYAETGHWGALVKSLLSDYFGPAGGTYFDVGANIGLTTIPIATNPKVTCISLEPSPQNFAYLQKNVAANCPNGNVHAKQIAAFDKPSTLEFELNPENTGDNRIRLGTDIDLMGEGKWRTVSIQALPLDEIAGTVTMPIAVKIDVQGAEPFVVKGGRKTLASAGLLILEFSPYSMARMGADPEEIFQCLQNDFAVMNYVIGEDGKPDATVSAAEGVAQLREMAAKHVDNIYFWVDVIARKPQAKAS